MVPFSSALGFTVEGLAAVPPCVDSQGRVDWPRRLRPTSMFQPCVDLGARDGLEQDGQGLFLGA